MFLQKKINLLEGTTLVNRVHLETGKPGKFFIFLNLYAFFQNISGVFILLKYLLAEIYIPIKRK